MPLESLSNEQINIHDLTLEEEKKPMPEWQKHYEDLKETPLYDAEKDQWNVYMNEDQVLTNSTRPTFDQLMGILVESKFNKAKAKELYMKLRKTPLYDKRDKIWRSSMTKDQSVNDYDRKTADQLLDILVEVQFNKEAAEVSYKKLKESKLYNKERNIWFHRMNKSGEMGSDPSNYTDVQLLDILIETQFDKSLAEESYNNLKETLHYDKDKQQWIYRTYENQNPNDLRRKPDDQLVGVLIEAQFNKKSAKKLFDSLKNSLLYNSERKQWNWGLDDNQRLIDSSRMAGYQLLGILCEKEFEEPDTNFNTTPPLPEGRNY